MEERLRKVAEKARRIIARKEAEWLNEFAYRPQSPRASFRLVYVTTSPTKHVVLGLKTGVKLLSSVPCTPAAAKMVERCARF